jgi:hypothetical protein
MYRTGSAQAAGWAGTEEKRSEGNGTLTGYRYAEIFAPGNQINASRPKSEL